MYRLLHAVELLVRSDGTYVEGEKEQVLREAKRLDWELKSPFLTTTPESNVAWGAFTGDFRIVVDYLEESRVVIGKHVNSALDDFYKSFMQVNGLIFDGMKNFKAGLPVYPETPVDELYKDHNALQVEYLRRMGLRI